MAPANDDICPHCHRQYKSIETHPDSQRVIYYYCEIEGDPERIEFPRCGGNRKVCERGLFKSPSLEEEDR